jgi:arylsulfatase B
MRQIRFLLILLYLVKDMLAAHKPNIVFILVDDLGWNDVSWHNTNLNDLARSGLEEAYSQPTCSPTRAALLTRYYPSRTGYQFMPMTSMQPIGLPTSFKLLREYIAKLGYSSHVLGKWHLGFCNSEYLPTSRGFESFYEFYNAMGNHKFHVMASDMKNIWGALDMTII